MRTEDVEWIEPESPDAGPDRLDEATEQACIDRVSVLPDDAATWGMLRGEFLSGASLRRAGALLQRADLPGAARQGLLDCVSWFPTEDVRPIVEEALRAAMMRGDATAQGICRSALTRFQDRR